MPKRMNTEGAVLGLGFGDADPADDPMFDPLIADVKPVAGPRRCREPDNAESSDAEDEEEEVERPSHDGTTTSLFSQCIGTSLPLWPRAVSRGANGHRLRSRLHKHCVQCGHSHTFLISSSPQTPETVHKFGCCCLSGFRTSSGSLPASGFAFREDRKRQPHCLAGLLPLGGCDPRAIDAFDRRPINSAAVPSSFSGPLFLVLFTMIPSIAF